MQGKRRSIRIKDYLYTDDGAYYVTICTHQKQCLFGTITDDGVWLSNFGTIVVEEWEKTAQLRDYVKLDAFVIMPNHVHGIIIIQGDKNVGARCIAPLPRKFGPLESKSLSTIVGTFKAAVTRQINRYRNTPSAKIWQRNYYERVIRNDSELNKIRNYIHTNPARWQEDDLYIGNEG